MKKLLIIALLVPLVGWGHDACKGHRHVNNGWGVDWPHGKCGHDECNGWRWQDEQPLTYTDGFGYELKEWGDNFTFRVYLDFSVPERNKCHTVFVYDGVEFRFGNTDIWAQFVKDRRCFTHEDAWNIRNMAWELVNGCERCVVSGIVVGWDYCPCCGKKLDK
jgi:hypothetical protein